MLRALLAAFLIAWAGCASAQAPSARVPVILQKPAVLSLVFAPAQSFNRNGVTGSSLTTWLSQVGGGAAFVRTGSKYNMSASTQFLTGVPAIDSTAFWYEPAGTNILPQSQALTTTPWTVNGAATVVANATTAPDGTTTGTSSTSSAAFQGPVQFTTVPNTTVLTQSVFGKNLSCSGTPTSLVGNDTNPSTATLGAANTSTGVAGGPGAAITASSAVAAGNGYFRFQWTYTTTGTTGDIDLYHNSGAVACSDAWWGAQMEASGKASTYIQNNTAGTATRNADALTLPVPYPLSKLTITFSDGTKQVITGATGLFTLSPALLNEPGMVSMIWSWKLPAANDNFMPLRAAA